MNKTQIIQTVGGLVALGLSIPTFIAGNWIMASALVIGAAFVIAITLKNRSE